MAQVEYIYKQCERCQGTGEWESPPVPYGDGSMVTCGVCGGTGWIKWGKIVKEDE